MNGLERDNVAQTLVLRVKQRSVCRKRRQIGHYAFPAGILGKGLLIFWTHLTALDRCASAVLRAFEFVL